MMLRQLVDAVPVGIALFDRDLRFRFVNEHLARINGRPAAEHVGRHPSEIGPATYVGLLQQVLDTGSPIVGHLVVAPRTSEHERPQRFHVDYVPVHDEHDGIVGVAAVVLDITGRLEAEERRAERTFELALEAVLDDVYIVRVERSTEAPAGEYVIEHVTSSTRDPFGRSAESLVGRSVRELYGEREAAFLIDHLRTARETGRRVDVPSMPYRLETGTGRLMTYWDMTFSRLDADRVVVGTRNVTEAVLAKRQLRETDARLAAERHTIAVLQDALLPALGGLPAGWSVGWHFESASEGDPIGGDWYDAFPLRDGRLGLAVGDIAGHGIEAAACMAQLRVLVRSLAFDGDDPGRVLGRVGQAAAAFGERLYATCLYAIVEPATGALVMASAGHPEPIICSGRSARSVTVTAGPPLGVTSDHEHQSTEAHLAPGDAFVAFTDGLVEDREHDIDARIDDVRAVLSTLDRAAPRDIASLVCRHMRPPAGFADDACVLVVRRDDPR
jgi:PAS domain S-box-containing protein